MFAGSPRPAMPLYLRAAVAEVVVADRAGLHLWDYNGDSIINSLDSFPGLTDLTTRMSPPGPIFPLSSRTATSIALYRLGR